MSPNRSASRRPALCRPRRGERTASGRSDSGGTFDRWTHRQAGRGLAASAHSCCRDAGKEAIRSSRLLRPRRGGLAVVWRQAVVVEPHERDHVAYVFIVRDPARGWALLAWEDGVVDDAAARVEVGPHGLREREVGRVVAVQMADLAAADAERELAAAARGGLDAVP